MSIDAEFEIVRELAELFANDLNNLRIKKQVDGTWSDGGDMPTSRLQIELDYLSTREKSLSLVVKNLETTTAILVSRLDYIESRLRSIPVK